MTKWYYTQNDDFVNHQINKTFDEVVKMDLPTFQAWVEELKDVILNFWDRGTPPRLGFDEDQMFNQVHELRNFDTHKLYVSEDGSTELNILKTSTRVGNFVNQFYPTMYKTRIDGDKSIYDYFAKPELKTSRYKRCERHFKKDGFYVYSEIVRLVSNETHSNPENFLVSATCGPDWIEKFESLRNTPEGTNWDYWLCPVDVDPKTFSMAYTGNAFTKYKGVRSFVLSPEQLSTLPIPQESLITTRIVEPNTKKLKGIRGYHIRLYNKNVKIFPLGFKSIRMSYSQYAVNFPPVIAKGLYEKYTKPNAIVWDCSAGWGGRLAGALTTKHPIHYIGNDPNTDHRTTPGRSKYHELADYILKNTEEKRTFEFYEIGSEDMASLPEFQKYRGNVDMVFTSPPYFCKEVYSNDPTQSANKFPEYENWLRGFLTPTLKTAYEWLKPGGYLVWNIADVKIGAKQMPLEADTQAIFKALGFVQEPPLRICMQAMQGSGRKEVNDAGELVGDTFNHPCHINGKPYKFEYLYICKKPA
jgi:hypothetical protein